MCRVPKEEDARAFGEVKQGEDCLDTLGHNSPGGTIGLFRCHDTGGNQVRAGNLRFLPTTKVRQCHRLTANS